MDISVVHNQLIEFPEREGWMGREYVGIVCRWTYGSAAGRGVHGVGQGEVAETFDSSHEFDWERAPDSQLIVTQTLKGPLGCACRESVLLDDFEEMEAAAIQDESDVKALQ